MGQNPGGESFPTFPSGGYAHVHIQGRRHEFFTKEVGVIGTQTHLPQNLASPRIWATLF